MTKYKARYQGSMSNNNCGRCGANCDAKRWAHSRYWFVCEKCKPVVEAEEQQDMREKGFCAGQTISSELGDK